MSENKIIFGRDRICKHYDFGKDTLKTLIEKGAPVKMVNNRYFIHTETMDTFLKDLSTTTAK